MVKVLAINSSPRMSKGTTALILNPFLEGMKEKGAKIEKFYTKQLNIKPCTACFNRWFPTEGECSIRDDMDEIIPKIAEADIFIVASPIYVDGITGPMKNIIDRMLPLLEPFVELRNGHCRHPLREYSKPGKVVYVSPCAWWKLDNFDSMILYIKAMCANMAREFAGALLRPHAGAMMYLKATGKSVDDIINAVKNPITQMKLININQSILVLVLYITFYTLRKQCSVKLKGYTST